jgi:hypothetical protein
LLLVLLVLLAGEGATVLPDPITGEGGGMDAAMALRGGIAVQSPFSSYLASG